MRVFAMHEDFSAAPYPFLAAAGRGGAQQVAL